MSSPKKILIIALCGVGDMLSFMPHLQRIRETYPDARIDLLARNTIIADWLRIHNLCSHAWTVVDRKYSSQKHRRLQRVRSFISIARKIRRERYDMSFWPYAQTTWRKVVLAKLLGARRTYMHTANLKIETLCRPQITCVPFDFTDAVVERNTALLQAAGVDAQGLVVQLPHSMVNQERGRKILQQLGVQRDRPVIGFHPGGNIHWTPYRQWPPERFAQLADRLCHALDAEAVLLGQADERPLLESIRNKMSRLSIVAAHLSFEDMVDVVASLNGLVGNESALVHLAGLSNIPSFSLVGSTNFHQTGPWGPQSRVVRLNLPCSPCFETGFVAHCPHRICMTELTVDRVYETILPVFLDLPIKTYFKPDIMNIPFEVPHDAQWQQFLSERNRWSPLRI